MVQTSGENIDDHPVTVWGGTFVLGEVLPHLQEAGGVEAYRAPLGAAHLHMAHVQVGGVDEGAGRE